MAKLCLECRSFEEGLQSRPSDAIFQETRMFFHREDADDGTKDFVLHHAVSKNHLDCVKEILDNGDTCNELSKLSGRTGLIVAAKKGFDTMVELLISRGADVNVKDSMVKNALWYAASDGYIRCVRHLLKAGSDYKYTDKYTKQSPLAAAAWGGHIECIEALITQGDTFGFFQEGEDNSWFLFGLSMCQLNSSTVKTLLDIIVREEGAIPFDIFMGIVNKNDRSLLQGLFDRNITIKHLRGGQSSPPNFNEALHAAAENSNDESIRVLLNNRSSLNIKINGSFGLDTRTVLQKACDQEEAAVVEVLLEHGADTEKIGNVGMDGARPPVFISLRTLSYIGCGLKILAALVKNGCNMERKCFVNLRGIPDNMFLTPLEYALCGGNLHAARILVLGGAQNYNPAFAMMKPHKKLVHKELECTKKQKEDFISAELHRPRTLYRFCRMAIRKCIRGDASRKIAQLPLARHVQDFISFGDIDQIAQEYETKMENLEISSNDDQEASCESFSGEEFENDDSSDVESEESGYHPGFFPYDSSDSQGDGSDDYNIFHPGFY